MSACCNDESRFDGATPAFRRVLWVVIVLNAAMFVAEMAAGLFAGSLALQADSLDFLGDTATYALSLWAIGRAVETRARAALVKGGSLLLLAAWIVGSVVYRALTGAAPDPVTMGAVGTLALAVNVACALLLLRYRNGDSNVRSVWLCSRNDAIGNVAVLLAATGVFATGTPWPDLAVAGLMGGLFLHSGTSILIQARGELRDARRFSRQPPQASSAARS